jgi:DNA-directed RNA polymerase subunit K/omega
MPVFRSEGPPRRGNTEQRDKKKRPKEEQEPEPSMETEMLHLTEPSAKRAAQPPKLTKYERVHILGSRACDLAAGAEPLLPVPGVLDPLLIAVEELERGLLHSNVVRTFPSGEQTVHPLQTLL